MRPYRAPTPEAMLTKSVRQLLQAAGSPFLIAIPLCIPPTFRTPAAFHRTTQHRTAYFLIYSFAKDTWRSLWTTS